MLNRLRIQRPRLVRSIFNIQGMKAMKLDTEGYNEYLYSKKYIHDDPTVTEEEKARAQAVLPQDQKEMEDQKLQ